MVDINATVDELTQELRRGMITAAVLSLLVEPQYGYSLVSILQEKGIPIDPGTLYPLLRKLEKQELLESRWDTNEARPRKYYLLSPDGKEVYRLFSQQGKAILSNLDSLLGGIHEHGMD